MSKRLADTFVDRIEKKVQKKALVDSLQMLAKCETQTPTKSSVALSLVATTPTKVASGSQPAGKMKCWPAGYHTLAKYPRGNMKAFLLNRAPALTEQKLAYWKLNDKDIVQHLFEFETGLDIDKPWPAGPCHDPDAFEVVLKEWVKKPTDYQQLNQLLDRSTGSQPDWVKNGVYQLFPNDEENKTHVEHLRSGKIARIPASMRVDGQWSFNNNWSATQAKLVDANGYGRVVTTFFPDAATSNVEWGEFAETEAKLCCKAPKLESEPSVKATLAQLCQNLQAEASYSVQQAPSTPPRSPRPVVGLASPASAQAPASPLEMPL
jgi:hypothetical protein